MEKAKLQHDLGLSGRIFGLGLIFDRFVEIPRCIFMLSTIFCNSGMHSNQDLVCFGADHLT